MDLNKEFLKFNDNIKLFKSKEEDLIRSSDALKDVINKYFEDNEMKKPTYARQGSFPMKTTLNNLKETDSDYDIDLGVYLSGYSDSPSNEWPATSTVHNWIFNATNNQTYEPNNNKNTCVRVNYKKDYHVDLPIYITNEYGETFLAHKVNGWMRSEPVEFTDWFNENVKSKGEQLRRIVRYIKAWRDYKGINLKSLCISILVCDNFESDDDSDHLALIGTLKNIIHTLENNFDCTKPVEGFEDLFEDENEELIMNNLNSFFEKISSLFNVYDDVDKINRITESLFGNRFPKIEKNDNNEHTKKPGVLGGEARSA